VTQEIVKCLLESDEPSIRYKIRVGVLGESPKSKSIRALREEIHRSPRVRQLLSRATGRGGSSPSGTSTANSPARTGSCRARGPRYPPGDKTLLPVRDQVFECWLGTWTTVDVVCKDEGEVRRAKGVPVINGRARRCGSQQGNALYAALTLGLANDGVHQLAECLMRWQWPDGGWNCDTIRKRTFRRSTRPFFRCARSRCTRGCSTARKRAVRPRAPPRCSCAGGFQAEARRQDHQPGFHASALSCYWHYDVLMGLKVMAETGFIRDPRCADALDLLEGKQLPAEAGPPRRSSIDR